MSEKLEWDDKRTAIGTILIVIGALMLLIVLGFSIYTLRQPYGIPSLLILEYLLLGVAIVLTGVFTIIKWKTKAEIIILGLVSTIWGGVLVILASMSIILFRPLPIILIFSFKGLNFSTFLTSGIILLLHGQILMIKKQKSMKIVWYAIFLSAGLSIIIYTVLTSTTISSFFDTALFLDLLITIPVISYFSIEQIKNERTKLLRGIISILAGGTIMIISISIFALYRSSIIMDETSLFVVFIILGLGLILYGIFLISHIRIEKSEIEKME